MERTEPNSCIDDAYYLLIVLTTYFTQSKGSLRQVALDYTGLNLINQYHIQDNKRTLPY